MQGQLDAGVGSVALNKKQVIAIDTLFFDSGFFADLFLRGEYAGLAVILAARLPVFESHPYLSLPPNF